MMEGLAVVLLLALVVGGQAACTIENAVVLPGHCAWRWASGLNRPRGIISLPNNDVLVVESGSNSISLLRENAGAVEKISLASASGLNHGIVFGGGYLYASSASTVYRWPYTVGTRTNLGTAQTVITGVPTGGHSTRTLVIDPNGNLIVQVGSNGNIDRSGVAALYRFNVSTFPTTFSTGAKFASGLRNEVGLRYDNIGRLWGVENGMDNLARADLGTNIYNQNPGEEVNVFLEDGKFYGYPDCWSQYNLTSVSTPRGTQYALDNTVTRNDAWCQNTANVVPPKYQLRAHTAPLDIIFFPTTTTFPGMAGDALVASHGSWNRQPPAGYSIVHINFNSSNEPVSDQNFFAFAGPGETGTNWPYRPVGLAFSNCGGLECVLSTDDSGGNIIAITYSSTCNCGATTTSESSGLRPQVFMLLFSLFILAVMRVFA